MITCWRTSFRRDFCVARRKIALGSLKYYLTLPFVRLLRHKRNGFLCRTREKIIAGVLSCRDEKFVMEAKTKLGSGADAILTKVMARNDKHRSNLTKV